MKIANPGLNVVDTQSGPLKARPDWYNWVVALTSNINALNSSGTTADRPTKGLFAGRTYFDTTLGQPIWYDGSGWVDATGTTA